MAVQFIIRIAIMHTMFFLNVFNGNVKITVVVIALIQLAYTLAGILLVSTLPQELTLSFLVLNIVIWYFVLTRLCKNHTKLLMKRKLKSRNDENIIGRAYSSYDNKKT